MSPTKLNFEMAPKIQEILQREIEDIERLSFHPSLSSDTKMDDWKVLYDPSMKLPDLDDKKAILAWLGINEDVSETVLQDYQEHLAGNVPQPYGTVLKPSISPESTLVDHLAKVFLLGIAKEWGYDEAEDFGM
jgi:hypothetical protein